MKSVKKIILGALCCACSLTAFAEVYDTYSDTWVCTDGLGREVAHAGNGVSRTAVDSAAQVGMFYYIWQGQHGGETKDITRLLEADPVNPKWGGEGQFHWGGKPVLGYYKGGDDFIIARHMEMLVDAGVNFYFFDVTNSFTYDDNVKAVMREIDRRKALNLKTPKLAFMTHSSSTVTVQHLYDTFYADSASYYKYWYLWDGKPLMLINGDEYNGMSKQLKSYFSFRFSWAWDVGQNKWSWLANYPQGVGYAYKNGKRVNEQISVSTAQHPSSKIGKSYHGGKQPSFDKYGLCKETPEGLYFKEQWSRALSLRPKVVMVTQWNEWMAQRFIIKSAGELGYVRPGATEKIGETYFVDVYNQEFNRDIEPSSEPLIRDNYYLQLVSNVRKYQGARPIPVPTAGKSITMNTDFSQWDDVTPEFRDEPGDCYYTSHTAQYASTFSRKTNDFLKAKVTKNADSLFFYVAVANDKIVQTVSTSSTRWMTLLLNTDCDATGWNGYDYMISNKSYPMYLYRYDEDAAKWVEVKQIFINRSGNEMMLGLPKADVGLSGDKDFDFKWIDNIPKNSTEILDFIGNGDAAPNGRFNYRYLGSQLSTVTAVKNARAASLKIQVKADNGMARVQVQVPVAGAFSMKIFNVSGKEVSSVSYPYVNAGLHTESFQFPSGTFVVKCSVNGADGTEKFVTKAPVPGV